MNSKHTPGPWEMRGDKVCESLSGKVIAATSKAGAFASQSIWYANPATFASDANARVIAAAPELFIACYMARKVADNALKHPHGIPRDILDDMRKISELSNKAIAKAEGK